MNVVLSLPPWLRYKIDNILVSMLNFQLQHKRSTSTKLSKMITILCLKTDSSILLTKKFECKFLRRCWISREKKSFSTKLVFNPMSDVHTVLRILIKAVDDRVLQCHADTYPETIDYGIEWFPRDGFFTTSVPNT